MGTKVTFFPVENGDMTLVKLGDDLGTTLLIDCNIRQAVDDDDGDTRDVAADLRKRLKRDGNPYVRLESIMKISTNMSCSLRMM